MSRIGVSRLKTLRAASGDLTAGETTASINDTSGFEQAVVFLDVTTLTLADADDEVDFYFQTTYDNGANWTDVENIHFTTADDGSTAERIIKMDGAKDGPGSNQSITGTDPAAGTEVSETVPANTIWSIRNIAATLVTDSNAANRRVRATLDDGSTVYYRVSSGVDQTLTLTVLYSWAPTGASAVGVVAVTDATVNIPLPTPTILSAGHRFITITDAILAGDNWGAPQLSVEAWHDPIVSTDGTMGDNLKSYDRPMGQKLRIKTTVTGATAPTYSYSATVILR